MPIHNFECRDCNYKWETNIKMMEYGGSDEKSVFLLDAKKVKSKMKCPKCGSTNIAKLFEGFCVNWNTDGKTRGV